MTGFRFRNMKRVFWNSPAPFRWALGRALRKLNILDYEASVELFLEGRAHYAYGVLKAAQLARRLGVRRISVIEIGVARGDGLVNLERHAEAVEKITEVEIEVHGFDSGEGLTAVGDYRDLPYIWDAGAFPMDVDALRARLGRAKLVLGDVRKTIPEFVAKGDFAPIGFIAHDLDLYSSTIASFEIFSGPDRTRLPRILNYFDDIILDDIGLMHDEAGELAAIAEFNAAQSRMRMKPSRHLFEKLFCSFARQWYVLHDLQHEQYATFLEKARRDIA